MRFNENGLKKLLINNKVIFWLSAYYILWRLFIIFIWRKQMILLRLSWTLIIMMSHWLLIDQNTEFDNCSAIKQLQFSDWEKLKNNLIEDWLKFCQDLGSVLLTDIWYAKCYVCVTFGNRGRIQSKTVAFVTFCSRIQKTLMQ